MTPTDSNSKNRLIPLTLGALGVVFGDIGTSPLYTLQECLTPGHGVEAVSSNLFGILSLVFWSLIMVVTLKYIIFLMRADNRGEGGIMALLALVPEKLKSPEVGKIGWPALLVIVGAGLLFGDGVITPAISVLSAVEGLRVAAPGLESWVVPITVIILVILFSFQKKGTEKIGAFFGPIMLLWFFSLGSLGVIHLVDAPEILRAIDPRYAYQFFSEHGFHGFRLLGSVVLAVTGGEALYADMGHFGQKPIRFAWVAIVLPCLMLNYLGQGAMILQNPSIAGQNIFYSLVPEQFLYPMIALATLATVIASQALISGAYSLTHQAVILGYFPRVTVKHTSAHGEGQIYVPFINRTLAVLCIALVLEFQKSSRLAAAYGLAVTGTMVITSIVFYVVARHRWNWNRWIAGSVLALFLAFDLPFFFANALKFFDGGWIPVFIGSGFFIAMVAWRKGRSYLARHFVQNSPPLKDFLNALNHSVNHRIPGTAVFLASNASGVPPVVLRMVKRFHALHRTVILLTVSFENVPYVCGDEFPEEDKRLDTEDLGNGFYRVILRYGFMEVPNIPKIMEKAFQKLELHYYEKDVLYILGRETFVERNQGSLPATTQSIFAFLSRNARNATDYFGLPPDQVIELGTQIDL